MNVHRLNEHGIAQFADYLSALRSDRRTPIPSELIDDPRFSELIEPIVNVDSRTFASKFEAGEYLHQILGPIPKSRLRSDVGLWSWLAILYFNELCPPDGNGHRSPKENAKYIARPGDHRYGLDKHLLFFPWKMCTLHRSEVRCFLGDPLGADSRAQREWTGYHFNVSTPIIELGAYLYGDVDQTGLKRGATGKRRGNLRRFVQVLKQLEVTYDIHGMIKDQLCDLLPRREFAGWIG